MPITSASEEAAMALQVLSIPAQLWAPCEKFRPPRHDPLLCECGYPLDAHSSDALTDAQRCPAAS